MWYSFHDHDDPLGINVQPKNVQKHNRKSDPVTVTPCHEQPKRAGRKMKSKSANTQHLQLLARVLARLAGLLGQKVCEACQKTVAQCGA
jgi:hypothetical protein